MLGQRTAQALAVLAAIAVCVGCSAAGEETWTDASPESQGYRWVGDGEEGNFASAYNFCQSTLNPTTQGQRLEGGSGPVLTVPGGPTTVPGYSRSVQSPRSEFSSRRQFWGCMESQGWAISETTPSPPPPKL